MAELARDELVASLKNVRLLSSGNHSDLVITCGDDTYNVHKAVVCSQSEFFDRAVKFPVGKEAAEGEIDLPADDPDVVKLLIQFFYESEYDPKLPKEVDGHVAVTVPETTGCQYKFPHTCKPNCTRTQDWLVCPHHRCSSGTCKERCIGFICAICTANDGPDDLLLHAQMYEVADKYDVAGLKLLSREKFARLCKAYWEHELFPPAMGHALSSTPDEDQGLREVLCKTLVDHPSLFEQAAIEKLMGEHTTFAYQVMKELGTMIELLRCW